MHQSTHSTKLLRDKRAWLLVAAAFMIQVICLLINPATNDFLGLITPHGEIGYNVAHYNSIKINEQRLAAVSAAQRATGHVVDYADIENLAPFGPPTEFRSMYDTVGYGVVIGLLWKLTGSLRYRDVQLLQMIIYALLMLLIYSLVLTWFDDRRIAWYIGWAHVAFIPGHALNVVPLRDIWAFYGVLILIHTLSRFLLKRCGYGCLALGATLVALCQWVRPTIFLGLFFACAVSGIYALLQRSQFVRIATGIGLLCASNILIFWVPFMVYNKAAFDEYLVMPFGLGALEGLGEFENEWGIELSDGWVSTYIGEKYGLRYGTPAFDRAAAREFAYYYRLNPWHFYKSLLQRLPLFMVPGLPCINYVYTEHEKNYPSLQAKIRAKLQCIFDSPCTLLDFLGRQIGLRLFFLVGYLGMIVALLERRWLMVSLIYLAGIFPAANCLNSHIEYRFLTPFYCLFPFFVGYGVWWLVGVINRRIAIQV